jgi:hypothetical protein
MCAKSLKNIKGMCAKLIWSMFVSKKKNLVYVKTAKLFLVKATTTILLEIKPQLHRLVVCSEENPIRPGHIGQSAGPPFPSDT